MGGCINPHFWRAVASSSGMKDRIGLHIRIIATPRRQNANIAYPQSQSYFWQLEIPPLAQISCSILPYSSVLQPARLFGGFTVCEM